MTSADFELDKRLAADTSPVISLPLCDVLLMKDARYPWLVLVPRRARLIELTDLDEAEQTVLWREVNQAGAALRSVASCDKLNLGVLGNIVRQLHVHIVLRHDGDEAWPGPVWGNGRSVPYAADDLATFIQRLKKTWAN
ncbi:MAG: HIT family protein [Rhodanobacter sp.]